MKAYTLNVDTLYLFFLVCKELNLNTEIERTVLLDVMAKNGFVENIVDTKMSEEEYVKHLADKFGNVLQIKGDK